MHATCLLPHDQCKFLATTNMMRNLIILFCLMFSLRLHADLATVREELFAIPSLEELPIETEILSEKEMDGVYLMEFYLSGPPFDGKPTRIHAFYARPTTPGPFAAVVQVHGSGLKVLSPDAAIQYAANGYACISLDWAGPDWGGDGSLRDRPYSEFSSLGNRAIRNPETKKWKIIPPEQDARTNGVRFIRRALQFLRSRPEIDSSKLCISGTSAGAQATLGVLGVEPEVRAAAVKYGGGFIKELNWGGTYGPVTAASRDEPAEADRWIAILDPKHSLGNIQTKTLILSGTDDIFYFMPAVLATWRAIPAEKQLLILPNDNHSQVGNEDIPRQWFSQVLNGQPEWPILSHPTADPTDESLLLAVLVEGPVKTVDFWLKRMPTEKFRYNRAEKGGETVPWQSVPAEAVEGRWVGKLPALAPGEQIIAYALATTPGGVRASSDTIEIPEYPRWRLPAAP
jgi:dienelactone hydrolase